MESIEKAISCFQEKRYEVVGKNIDSTKAAIAALCIFTIACQTIHTSVSSMILTDIRKLREMLDGLEIDLYAPRVPEILIRPWGHMEIFDQTKLGMIRDNTYGLVRLIHVKPGEALSLQSHDHRDELFIPLDHHCKAEVGGNLSILQPGQVVYVPHTQIHRMSAADDTHYTDILELAFSDGLYNQNDIHRYDDRYGRQQHGE